MLKLERHQKIVEYVNEYGAATVDDLASETQASLATIRRDLIRLDQEKRILRTTAEPSGITSPRWRICLWTCGSRCTRMRKNWWPKPPFS